MVLAVLLWRGGQAAFVTDYIGLPGPTTLGSDFDRTVETREVTLNAETWYAIQTGVFSTQEAAVQKADAYTQRGAPGTVVRQGEKWRVFIACYGTEEEAAAVRTRLESNQKVDTYLYAWECPEVRLRLSGMAGQLDAAEAGFTLLTTTAATLRDTAMELDAAQLTNQEVMASARALDDQISLWEDTVRSRFGKSVPALVEGILTITGGWDARYAALVAAQDATALSAALKAQAMGLYDDICTWRTALKAQ
ncbi:MAG: SPOR domain-containing protein [Clostridia bacterium]|nr:SPOR domain-containing protein [Clostridia bacterium]